MAKFIYIDQSLHSLGGHHYDFAVNLLNAVQEQGYQPVLGAHRNLRGRVAFPDNWQVFTCFRYTTFSRHAIFESEGQLPRAFRHTAVGGDASNQRRSWLTRLKDSLNERSRQAELRAFSQACETIFSQVNLVQGDHVFFATVSEFDFLGLADFFARFPAGDVANWHLQFHFGIFNGRPAEYAQQDQRLSWVRESFEHALQQSQGKQLHFYNTSLPLVDQYRRLGMGTFHNLPYPINQSFQPIPPAANVGEHRPLRVTCGGGYRAEQGKERLAEVLADVWQDCFANGRMQLVVQSKRSRWSKLRLPGATPADDQATPSDSPPPVVLVPHPLEQDRYVELIRQTDIGLLLYDSRRYYARRAGVLCELLCAGVPVIVPAGCWLSEQIAEAGFEHLDRIWAQHESSDVGRAGVIDEQVSVPGSEEAVFSLGIPDGAGDLMIGLHRRSAEPLTYVRMTVEQLDSDGQTISAFSHIVGERANNGPVRTMWRVAPQADSLRLTLQNAYDETATAIDRLEHCWLEQGEQLPLASVGLIAADDDHAGRLLIEMRDHYHHYRRTANEFSEPWRRGHDPRLTATTLVSPDAAAMPTISRLPATPRAAAA